MPASLQHYTFIYLFVPFVALFDLLLFVEQPQRTRSLLNGTMMHQRACLTTTTMVANSKSSVPSAASGLRLPSLFLLLVLLCISCPHQVSAWVQTRPPQQHPRGSALKLQARVRNKSTSALASSISAPPSPDQAQQSMWGSATASESSSRTSGSSSSTTAAVVSTSEQSDDQQVDQSAYLDLELVKRTVAAVFTTDATASASASASSSTAAESTTAQSSPVYLFDGICNFCDASMHFCYDNDAAETLRFAPLQSPTGRALLQHFGKHPDDTDSLLLVVDPETAYFGSDAVLQTATRLEGLPGSVRALARQILAWVPRRARDAAYRLVAEHRHVLMGTSDGPQCRVDLDYARFLDEVVLDAEDSYEYDGNNQ